MYDYQRQLVRTVVAVLDAFHFDLSKAPQGKSQRKLKPRVKPETTCPSESSTEPVKIQETEKTEIPAESVETTETDGDTEIVETNEFSEGTGDAETTESKDAETTEISEDVETEAVVPDDEPEISEEQKQEEELETVLETIPENAPVTEKPLAPDVALRVKQTILNQLLPRLQGVISARTAKDSIHKVSFLSAYL
jgi:U3 small nucleolar RNA-associated protein 20